MKRPRILFLTAYYYPFMGGVESHARQLAAYLKNVGFDVCVVTKRAIHRSSQPEKLDGIPIYRIPPAGERTSLNKWFMIPYAVFTIVRLRRAFDLIYCPGYRGIGIAAILAGKLLRKPVILKSGNIGILSCRNWDPFLTRLNIVPQSLLASFIKLPIHKIYAAADAFACISREIQEEATQCNIPAGRIHYIPEGVDSGRYRPPRPGEKAQVRAEEGWSGNRVVCMYVGRLSAEKGALDLIEAWCSMKNDDAILVVVGPDMPGHHMDIGPSVRRIVVERELEDRVILYGPCEDVPRLLRAADIFIQPSHYEAFGISVIEAMATGLPVVATKVGGMNDYLIDGTNSLLCEPSSSTDLALKISRLIHDASFRDMLGKKARETVELNFEEKVVFERFANLFQESVDENGI